MTLDCDSHAEELPLCCAMAFLARDIFVASPAIPLSGYRAPLLALTVWPIFEGDARDAPRVVAAGLAILVTWLVFASLSVWTHNVSNAPQDRFDVLQLALPKQSSGVAEQPSPPNSGIGSPIIQPPQAGTSPVETSTVTPLSIIEWSVSRIVPPPSSTSKLGPSSGNGAGTGVGNGSGAGGSGVYDPYAGASPQRAAERAVESASNMGLDRAAVERLRSDVSRRLGGRVPGLRCDVLIALTGVVLEAWCSGAATGQDLEAVNAMVVGRLIFAPATVARRTIIDLGS